MATQVDAPAPKSSFDSASSDSTSPGLTGADSDSVETVDPVEIRERIQRGIQLCRAQQLEKGYRLLRTVTQDVVPNRDLPGLFFSYLGYGIAAFEARYNDGLALCERAIEMEFYNTENHYNLARTYMLLGSRKKTISAIRAGLRVDADDRALRLLLRELGVRKRPPIPFLNRNHGLNRWLGNLLHFLTAPPHAKDK